MFKGSRLCRYLLLNVILLGLTGFAHKVVAQEHIFTYNNFPLSLPEGWVKQDISQGSEKEVVGSLKSEKTPGTTILVLCYKGWRYNYGNVRMVSKPSLRFTPRARRCSRRRRK